ncbi:hypothetical protein HELRODRAFT_152996, partial [Helobdella robusta]|uniref:RING-type domain-containing protein n=1 Tax=Helobdella robusta TaxID=6412 RepID=T1EKY6_HELRO
INKFSCPICKMVVYQPKETPCKHIFCFNCVAHWIRNSARTCPLCRHRLQLEDLTKPQPQYLSELSSLKVLCSFKGNGCTEELELKYLSRH